MTDFDERLKELQKQISQKSHFETMKEKLLQQKNVLVKKIAELEAMKQKEQSDVEKLEGKTLKAFFCMLAGSREEKLSKERQEAYEAAMKYDASVRYLEGMEADLRYYQEELDRLADCEAEYAGLLEQKKNLLKTEQTQKANDIMLMEKELAELEHELTELEEALDCGYKAFDIAEKIVSELKEAYDLADWDIFMDSMLLDMQKHEHMHTAQDLSWRLNNELRRFKTELADVQIGADIDIKLDDFSEFADWFFDNIFIDGKIRDRIESSHKQAYATKEKIRQTIHRLKDMRDARMIRRAELEEDLEEAVLEG